MSVRSAEVTALARTCCVAAKIDVGVSILNGLGTTKRWLKKTGLLEASSIADLLISSRTSW